MVNLLIAAALAQGVPADIFVSMCWVESNHNQYALSVNDGGEDSIGVCQIKLTTAREVGYKGGSIGLFDPATNARYAAKYFKKKIRLTGGLVSGIIAYNAGKPIRYRRYVDKVFEYAVQMHMESK